jgi:hypothetical protein
MSFLSGSDTELARQIAYALEDESFHPLDEVQDNAPEDCRYFSDLECSLSEWGFAYGVAWATARTREPFASVTRISALAKELAREAWRYHSSKERWQELLTKDRDQRGPVHGDPATQLEAFTRNLGSMHVRRQEGDRIGH